MHLSNPETPLVLKSIPEWIELYKSGISCPDIAKKYNINKGTVNRRLKESGISIRSRSEVKLSSLNPMWKEKAGSNAIHQWVRKRLPKPEFCPNCNIRKTIDLANISNSYNPETYTRELKNWEWLCRKCHMTKDGRFDQLYHGGAHPIYTQCTIKECSSKHHALGFCTKHYQRKKYRQKVGIKNDY